MHVLLLAGVGVGVGDIRPAAPLSLEETETPSPAKSTESSGSPASRQPFITCSKAISAAISDTAAKRGPRVMESAGRLHDQPGGVTKPRALMAYGRWARVPVRAAPGEGCACPAVGQSLCTWLPGPQCALLRKILLGFSGSSSFQGPSIQVLLPELPAWISPGERTGRRDGHPCPTMPFFFVGELVISVAPEVEQYPFIDAPSLSSPKTAPTP